MAEEKNFRMRKHEPKLGETQWHPPSRNFSEVNIDIEGDATHGLDRETPK